MTEIAKESFFWDDSDGSRGLKLTRLSFAFRSAAIKNPKVYIMMVGAFPRLTDSPFGKMVRSRYVDMMCDARDFLVNGRAQVPQDSIVGYVPLQEAPVTQFFFVATVLDDPRLNPFQFASMLSREQLKSINQNPAAEEDKNPVKYVVDPFSKADDSPTGDTARVLKAQLEINVFDAAGIKLNAPGEFKATLELRGDKLKEVGFEWGAVEKKIVARALGGRISNVKFTFTVAGKLDMTSVSAKKVFGDWSAEAKASIEADLSASKSGGTIHVEVGVKMDSEKRTAFPVLEFSFD